MRYPGHMRREELLEFIEARKFTLLLGSIAVLFILPLFQSETSNRNGLLWGVVLIAAVRAASGRRWVTIGIGVLAVLGYAGRVYSIFDPGQRTVQIAALLLALVFMAVIVYTVLKAVLRAPHINGDTVAGAVCAYLFLGLLFAMLFGLLEAIEPGSFEFPADVREAGLAQPPEYAYAYYSYVTLTTLGYGDITPVTFRARALSWMEAVVGVTFMATLIAFLVSHVVVDRQKG